MLVSAICGTVKHKRNRYTHRVYNYDIQAECTEAARLNPGKTKLIDHMGHYVHILTLYTNKAGR